jgi:hypothetical protein
VVQELRELQEQIRIPNQVRNINNIGILGLLDLLQNNNNDDENIIETIGTTYYDKDDSSMTKDLMKIQKNSVQENLLQRTMR